MKQRYFKSLDIPFGQKLTLPVLRLIGETLVTFHIFYPRMPVAPTAPALKLGIFGRLPATPAIRG